MDSKLLISKLIEATDLEKTVLNQHRINTMEDLWQRISEIGIQKLAQETQIHPSRLLVILTKQIEHEVKVKNFIDWLRSHWFDVIILIIIFSLVVLILRILESFNIFRFSYFPGGLHHSVVVSTKKLPAFYAIKSTDIQIKYLTEPNTFNTLSDVVGRYTFKRITEGSVLRQDQVSAVQLSSTDLVNRQILTLPIDSDALPITVTPGSRISLLFSSSDASQAKLISHTLDDAILLAINKGDQNISLVIAVKTDNSLEKVKPMMGIAKIFILQK